jgi:menaquinone-dependent protoporphyrinogen oxidase
MTASVLIAYASRGGSTAEIAQAMGAALHEAGLESEIVPVGEIGSISGKTTVILGAPLYVGRFPKEFYKFLVSNRAALAASRCWCFVVGPTRNEPEDFESARMQASKQLLRYGWFHPVDVHIFGGRWSLQGLPFPFSLALHLPGNPLAKIPPSDIRDWAAIHDWTMGIACQIAPAA